jgi:hypothetical protein
MKTVKKAGIWFLALFLLVAHVLLRSSLHAEELSTWQQIKTKAGDCSISFPVLPKFMHQSMVVSKQGHKLDYDIYLAPLNDKALCLLLVATYPFQLKEGHELAGIEGLLNGIVGQSPDNKLIFANLIEIEKHKAVDFLVQSPKSYFRGAALMIGNKLYLIAIEGLSNELNEEAFARFTQSFSLIKKAP